MSEIQRLDLFRDRQKRDWVTGLNSEAAAILPDVVVGNTIEFALRDFTRNPASPAATLYLETPWNPTLIRASIGLIDAGAEYGSFKLKVADQTTAALAWYAPGSSAATIATWKAGILTALRNLSNVGNGAVNATDPVDCPPHHFYFTWTDAADERAIEVVLVKLVPAVEPIVEFTQGAPAAEQRISLAQLPIKLTSAFAFPTPAALTCTQETEGGASANEVQIFTVPVGATGAFTFTWATKKTRPMTIAGLSASVISQALNEVVADGATNPSFRVAARARGKWEITFIGPLASAPQPELTMTAIPADATVIAGKLLLTSARFDRALNGQPSVKLKLEVTIADADGSQTIIREIKLLAPMTRDSTESAIEEAGAVIVRTETVYVDNSTTTPIVTVAAGISFLPAVAAASFAITHSLGTKFPNVLVFYESSLSPEYWTLLTVNGPFSYTATDANHVTINFAYALSADTGSPLYFGRYKAFIASPDSTVKLLAHLHSFLEVTSDGTLGGQTLAAKLAELATAIGLVDGTLPIDAARITGALKPGQIDISALSKAFLTNSEMLATLRELVKDSTLIDNIAERLGLSTKFIDTLKTLLSTNADIIAAEVAGLKGSVDFLALIREQVLQALQNGAALPEGTIIFAVPDFETITPPPYDFVSLAGTGTYREFAPLSPCVVTSAGSATLSGDVFAAGEAGYIYTCSADVQVWTNEGRRGQTYQAGATLTYAAGHWYEVIEIGSAWYPAEHEQALATVHLNATQFYAGSQFVFSGAVQAELQTAATLAAGRTTGRARLVVERGAYAATAGDLNISAITWTEIAGINLHLGPSRLFQTVVLKVARAGGGTITGTIRLGAEVALSGGSIPPAADFAMRLRLSQFDTENQANPRGSLILKMAGALASIVPA